MIPVEQTRFGGPHDPVEEHGNCHAAALASILELSLADVPDVAYTDEFRAEWDAFFERAGIAEVTVSPGEDAPLPGGYTLGGVLSRRIEDCLHTVVCFNGYPVFDPNPLNADEKPYTIDEVEYYTFIYPLEPGWLGERMKMRSLIE